MFKLDMTNKTNITAPTSPYSSRGLSMATLYKGSNTVNKKANRYSLFKVICVVFNVNRSNFFFGRINTKKKHCKWN